MKFRLFTQRNGSNILQCPASISWNIHKGGTMEGGSLMNAPDEVRKSLSWCSSGPLNEKQDARNGSYQARRG